MMNSQARKKSSGFFDIDDREIGLSRPRKFARRIGGSEVLLKRLDLSGKLTGHEGCVNTVHFSPTGELLISGSDDMNIILWNWDQKTKRLLYHSGHEDNVFQARAMPYTNDSSIVTSAADGQVRHGKISDSGDVETKMLGKHEGRAHKLAIEPGSPHTFYSCGEDGVVERFDLRCSHGSKLFTCMPFKENSEPQESIRLNAIVIDPCNPLYFAVGGDEEYARVYDIRSFQLDGSSKRDRPVNTFSPRHLLGESVHITGLAYSNTRELLVSYNDELVYLFQKDMGLGANPKEVSHEWLQSLDQPKAYSGHRNSETVKGVSFFGPSDEYVVSGSDCGHIFIWRKKDAELLHLMVGDQHVVNCLEPHPTVTVLATSGIENDIKLWAPIAENVIPLPDNVNEIIESNKQAREHRARMSISPDVIMRILRMQRRQSAALLGRRSFRREFDLGDGDELESFVVGIGDSDAASDDDVAGDCNIS